MIFLCTNICVCFSNKKKIIKYHLSDLNELKIFVPQRLIVILSCESEKWFYIRGLVD